MANIISIGTALPEYCHRQSDILQFMQKVYRLDENEARKLAFLYKQSEIENRYSVLKDFAKSEQEWRFVKPDTFGPSLDERLSIFHEHAVGLSVEAINNCVENIIEPTQITHLITVSCTGLSAPGLDLQISEQLQLPLNTFRTSINFMGCYAAIHAMKIAKMICDSSHNANVIIVCTEICTIHFQQNFTPDNAASSLLFGDGSAAVLVSGGLASANSLKLKSFHSEISYKGKEEMSWQVSERGFLMKLSSYIPQLIQEDIAGLTERAMAECSLKKEEITHWCLHPGGKKILEVIKSQLSLSNEDLSCSRNILAKYGNMSSPTILFVLKEIMENIYAPSANVFGVAFGPGLTMETFIASKE